eukprot:Clim_evm66s25 gene=Clim_evmTU66s25
MMHVEKAELGVLVRFPEVLPAIKRSADKQYQGGMTNLRQDLESWSKQLDKIFTAETDCAQMRDDSVFAQYSSAPCIARLLHDLRVELRRELVVKLRILGQLSETEDPQVIRQFANVWTGQPYASGSRIERLREQLKLEQSE